MELSKLVPYLAGVRVESVLGEDDWLLIRASALAEQADCPGCGVGGRRVHSSYERRLTDPAIGGRATTIELTVRRFFCESATCVKKTFVEQVPGLTNRHARHTTSARNLLQAIALALGGRAGARLLGWLALPAGRMSLLRLIRAMPEPPPSTPRVLGVDDFALRRGHIYGTVLIDMTTRRPVDVLPDRTAETLANWLSAHPGVEVICRDRSGAYAEGARQGAPDAMQVADRWHLWRNLGDAVETVVVTHRGALAEPDPPAEDQPTPPPDGTPAPTQRAETQLAARTRERYAVIQDLLRRGVSRAGISRQLRLDPHTVRRFADASSIDDLLVNAGPRDSVIDAFRPYLHQRWNEGCTDATVLYQEIRQLGFTGSDKTVRRYVHPFRANITAPPPVAAPPKARHVARWIMTDPANLDADDRARLDAINTRSPAIRALAGHVRAFATMMRHLTGVRDLPQWIDRIQADELPGLRAFANSIQRDIAAVTAGLSQPYSSGPVEGHVNRIKMIKRQMYGRANFDLLRRRILAPL